MSHFCSFSLSLLQDIPPKATEELVQGVRGRESSPGSSLLVSFLPLLLFIPLFFFMSRRQKKEQERRAQLKKGDIVVSQAGLVGELVEMGPRTSKVLIAPNLSVQILTASLAPFGADEVKKG